MTDRKLGPALAAALLAATTVVACSTTPPATAPNPQAAASTGQFKTLQRMYAAADADHDGRVTRDEARGRLPITYSNFSSVDVDKGGYVTLEEFIAFHEARTAKHADDIIHMGDQF